MNIVDYIGVGKENAVTREQLVLLLNMNDRTIRELIEVARRNGTVIINDQDGKGYYISNELSDLYRQYKANQHRALSILAQQAHLRKLIREHEAENQLKIL